MTVVTDVLDVSLTALDFDAAIPCACKGSCSHQEHDATWWITLSCGCCYPFCESALKLANLRLKLRRVNCRLCGADRITVRSVIRI